MLLDKFLGVAEAEEEGTVARKIVRKTAVRMLVRTVVDHIAADIGSAVETGG